MKTVIEWMQEMPESVREKAIFYTENSSWNRSLSIQETLHAALHVAFSWFATHEGVDFWLNVYRQIRDGSINTPQKNTKGFGVIDNRFLLWSRS